MSVVPSGTKIVFTEQLAVATAVIAAEAVQSGVTAVSGVSGSNTSLARAATMINDYLAATVTDNPSINTTRDAD